jgi:hypothetical protein
MIVVALAVVDSVVTVTAPINAKPVAIPIPIPITITITITTASATAIIAMMPSAKGAVAVVQVQAMVRIAVFSVPSTVASSPAVEVRLALAPPFLVR